jgi:hypothetical protein
MSSLFEKLKALVSARARGPRRYRQAPEAPDEAAQETASVPEVAEAPAHRRKMPEVSEGQQPAAAIDRPARTASAGQPAPRLQERAEAPDRDDALEDDRIVDLLKDKDA